MKIIISNNSNTPIYEQIMEEVKKEIIEGKLKTNDKLPSIRTLAKDLNISVITTKRAYDELEKEGYIITYPGKGSFIGAVNNEIIKEGIQKEIESNIKKSIELSNRINLNKDDLIELINLLYEGDIDA
ncbi:GntR family transcriptional regulator [Clostridium sp.]|uniref:GntR family transcriptional regulator n=1 Tax=Clostridium sp. TaxID=1506 RepID=UPI002613DF4B|nr:GntR family transcriptional regulator [Clostridium sp.]